MLTFTNQKLSANEEIIDYPSKTTMINAVKISGRTKNGLGIGFFNAITEKTDATIRNTDTGESRRETVEPFTNYNIFVVDQLFNGNSSISLVNTNVIREGSDFRDANVTALVANVFNKRNTYNIRGNIRMSNRNLPGEDNLETGLSSFILIRKAHGNWRYSMDHRFSNENFNIKNGNNIYLMINATLNPGLSCIEVDNPIWSDVNWTDIDPASSFSSNCSGG